MKKPEKPANEQQRIQCLLSTGLLDTPPDERFDRITRLAQKYFGVPITMVSLVDKERQWFKSKIGFTMAETPRDISFCGHAILQNNVFFVPDARSDDRFSDNPLVLGPPNIIFYAGLPLSGIDGSKIGTLCIVDTAPRQLSSEDISVMRDLADCAEDEIALIHERQLNLKLNNKSDLYAMVVEAIGDGQLIINPADGTVQHCTEIAGRMLNMNAADVIGKHISALIPLDLQEIK